MKNLRCTAFWPFLEQFSRVHAFFFFRYFIAKTARLCQNCKFWQNLAAFGFYLVLFWISVGKWVRFQKKYIFGPYFTWGKLFVKFSLFWFLVVFFLVNRFCILESVCSQNHKFSCTFLKKMNYGSKHPPTLQKKSKKMRRTSQKAKSIQQKVFEITGIDSRINLNNAPK